MDCRSLGTVASQTNFSHAHALAGIPTIYSWFTRLVTELVLGTHTHTFSRQKCGVCIISLKWVRDSSVKGVSDITQERERVNSRKREGKSDCLSGSAKLTTSHPQTMPDIPVILECVCVACCKCH